MISAHKRLILYIIIYILLSIFTYLLTSYEKNEKIHSYLNNITKTYSNAYDTIYNKYSTIANIVFFSNINTKELKEIFK